MTQRFKYKLYLIALCLTSALSLKAQYSEDNLLSEANVLFEQHKYAEAMPLYAQLLSLEPTKPEFNYKYGATALYGDATKKEEAIKYLRFASTKTGIDKNCWYFLGKAYHLNYQFADAINAYQKFQELASKKEIAERNVDREIEDCRNGQNLLSNIKEVTVLAKNKSLAESFFRIYDLSDIGGKILVTPDALLSSLDKKRNHKSLILFRGSGTTVYFSSYGKDGDNGLDIYQAEVLPNGAFSNPQKLGPEINTPYDEDYPFLHPDNTTFYFSSKGHSSMGGYDIFRADLDASTGRFTTAKNLDFAINTPDDDLFYVADSAKQLANFASSRGSTQGELDVYKVLVKSVPAEITLIKGSFSNKISPENKLAKITVVDASTNAQIDVQYTDPNSGDYVLSFPRSGRFKFLVEIEKSNQIHSGTVDIPKSSGIKAYLQNMQLVSSSGVEKLLINNLFDQTYDGDVTALAQKLLRQRAALDVNFNASGQAEEPVLQPESEQDIAMAYTAAGFGAGLNNEKVLNTALERTKKIGSQAARISQLKNAANQNYFDVLAVAEAKQKEASGLIAQADKATGDERSKIMFDAGIAKLKAENALNEAESSKALIENLSKIEERTQTAYEKNQQFNDSLKAALEGDDYNAALTALKREKENQENTDKSVEKYNPVTEIQSNSSEAQRDAKKYLDRASSLRAQNDELKARLVTRNRQRETAKGKDATKLDGEIVNLKAEIASSERRTDKAFAEAAMVQKEAFSKSQQYDILAALSEDSTPDKTVASAANEIKEGNLDQVALSISKLSIDNQAVSSYLTANPDAGNVFENDQVAMAFKREYAPDASVNSQAGVQNDDALLASFSTNNDKENVDLDKSNSQVENLSNEDAEETENGIDPSASTQAEIARSDRTDSAKNLNESSQDETITQDARNSTNEEVPKSSSADLAENKSDESENSLEEKRVNESISNPKLVGDEIANATPDVFGNQGSDSKGNSLENSLTVNELAKSDSVHSVATGEGDDVKKPEITEIPKQIKAEKVKISAASDWIAIIDASIAELEDELAANTATDKAGAQAQLDQYRELRTAKEKEISVSEASIQKMQSADRTDAEALASVVAAAENDVDTLSSSLVSRLEMKSNESATDIQSIKNIRKVDSNYLPELASIELSGLSDPEIANKRIALNENFIASVDKNMSDSAVSELWSEQLLELRRMKMLEILQDRKVQTGEMAYQARTPEAREYKSMVSETVTADEQINKTANNSSQFPNLSPELAAELQLSYSRNVILPGYEVEMKESDLQATEEAKAASRIDINKDYLKNLHADIEIYSAALNGTTNANNKIALQKRYDLLLAERSAVIDEIDKDQTFIENISLASNEPENGQPELAENTNQNENTLDHSENAESTEVFGAESQKIKEEPRNTSEMTAEIVHHFDSLYQVSSDEILAEKPNKLDELTRMSALNAQIAAQIDASINELIAELDDPSSNVNRDLVQQEIQQLDDIAADKRQEADRLKSEAEMLAAQTKTEVNRQIDNSIAENGRSNEVSANSEISTTEIRQNIEKANALIQTPKVSSGNYKSLNANITFNGIRSKMDSSIQMRQEAQNLVNQIETMPQGVQKNQISAELANLNTKLEKNDAQINEVIANSNAAEIAFFQSANDAVMSEIQNFPTASRETIPIRELTEESSRLAMQLSENESNLQKGIILNSEKISRDRDLIAKLDALNTQLDDIVEAHEIRVVVANAVDNQAADTITNTNQEVPELSDIAEIAILEKSANYQPEKGMSYITPIFRDYESKMAPKKKADYIANNVELQVSPILYESANEEADYKLLSTATKIDEKGIRLLKGSPEKLNYLTASIKADSLKKIESRKADYAERLTNNAKETLEEVKRLENAKKHENIESRKIQIQNRIDRLTASASEKLEKASLAAYQAEDLRTMRQSQEEVIARSATYLQPKDLAELNAVLNNKTYTVVTSDLASTEIHDAKPVKSTPKKDLKINVVPPASPEKTPDSDIVTVNENLSSIDEKLLLEAHGNWLNVVEVIAEKDDFSDVKESLFIDTDQPIYSKLLPIPMNPELPKGLIFQVQVGAFRNKIPQDLFGDFAPIMGEKLDNGITRYRAGIFKQYRNALEAKTKIRARGYSDAFVVAYIDGERLTGAQAQDILRQARVNEGVTAEEIAQNKAAENPGKQASATKSTDEIAKIDAIQTKNIDYYSDPEAAQATQVEVTPGLFYTVQVGVYSKPVKLDKLFNLVELNSELTASKFIRYTSGRYSSVKNATVRKSEAIAKGVTDAFITAYYNGVRISLTRAQELLDQKGNSILSAQISKNQQPESVKPVAKTKSESTAKSEPFKDNVRYVIILGSYAGDIPQNVANVFLDRSDLQIRRVTAPNGISIYASPEFETKAEAEDFLKLSRKAGIDSAIMGQVVNGKITSVDSK